MVLAATVYAEQLYPLGHGTPLWVPEPPQGQEISIGDVGYMESDVGRFFRFFNVTLPEDHPINRDRIPAGFTPLTYDEQLRIKTENFIGTGPLCSNTVKVQAVGAQLQLDTGIGASAEATYQFKRSSEQGAVLILKDGAVREAVNKNKWFTEYIIRHHDSWYSYACDTLRLVDIRPEEIILVVGTVKASQWVVAAFTDRAESHQVTFRGQFGPSTNAGFSVTLSEAVATTPAYRWGPQPICRHPSDYNSDIATAASPNRILPSISAPLFQDQCVFLSSLKLKKRKFLPDKIEAAAEPIDPTSKKEDSFNGCAGIVSGRETQTNSVEMSPAASHRDFHDPKDDILDYILMNSDAEVAVVCDSDLSTLFGSTEWPTNVGSYLEQVRPMIQVDSAKVGSLLGDDIRSGPDHEGESDEADTQWAHPDTPDRGSPSRSKIQGACARCKCLKVKCEFETDSTICKRCFNGQHECVIPGRKKRRAPPKREQLLNQISEQAAQINKLMEQLEEAKRRSDHAAQDARLQTPSSSTTYVSIDTTVTKPDLQDWIAKARKSIEACGDYINIGGPSAMKKMLAQSDDTDKFEFAVEADVKEDDWDMMTDGEGASGKQHRSENDSSIATTSSQPLVTQSTSESRRRLKTPSTDRLATIPSEATPFGLMASLSLKKSKRRRLSGSRSDMGEDEEEEEVGLANDDYFKPNFAPERRLVAEQHQLPHILRSGIVNPAEVESLFKIYWDYMNLSVSLLDPELYTAQTTYWRSPFLFTVICAIASRYYTARPTLYQEAMHCAQLAAGAMLVEGRKNVEAVQAYILLAMYPVPSRRWEDDRSWMYLGLAIRIATDLNLHHPNTAKPRNELHGREMLNRTRVWLNCFNLDRSTGSQYGKMPIVNSTDFTANLSGEWWNSSLYNMPNFDIHVAAQNAGLAVLGKFREKIYSVPNNFLGYNKSLDLGQLASETDDDLARLWETWLVRVHKYSDRNDPKCRFRTGLLRLAYSYIRLTALSLGFKFAFEKSNYDVDIALLWRCLRAATDTVKAMVDEVGVPSQRVYLRHGPEAQSVFVTFASAFLIKLLQPKYSVYFAREQRLEIRELVQRVVDLLGSTEVAIDERHGPKLYSQFLKGLLATPMAQVDHESYVLKKELAIRQPPSESTSASPLPSQLSELHYKTPSIIDSDPSVWSDMMDTNFD